MLWHFGTKLNALPASLIIGGTAGWPAGGLIRGFGFGLPGNILAVDTDLGLIRWRPVLPRSLSCSRRRVFADSSAGCRAHRDAIDGAGMAHGDSREILPDGPHRKRQNRILRTARCGIGYRPVSADGRLLAAAFALRCRQRHNSAGNRSQDLHDPETSGLNVSSMACEPSFPPR